MRWKKGGFVGWVCVGGGALLGLGLGGVLGQKVRAWKLHTTSLLCKTVPAVLARFCVLSKETDGYGNAEFGENLRKRPNCKHSLAQAPPKA